MAELENDTGEPVDYVVEEGQGTTGISLFRTLEPGQVKALRISNERFNIFFYEKGAHLSKENKPLAFEREVPRASLVKLSRPASGRWAITVESASLVR